MTNQLLQKSLLLFTVALSNLLFQPTAFSEDERGTVVAVQSRKYQLKHEFYFAGGVLPLDAFAKGLTGGGSYTYHINNFWGVEIINFHIAENFDTGLKEDLQQNFGVSTTQFNLVNYLATANLVLKPVYGKLVFFNRTILPGEVSLILGGGAINFDDGIMPAVDAGIILRVWLNKIWSVRIDARDYVASDGETFENVLHIGMGLAINVGGNS